MTDQDINDLRRECERGLTTLSVMNIDGGTTLVILQGSNDDDSDYHCHRYFKIGNYWNCSYDGQRVPLANVWNWLNNPCAYTANRAHPTH